jgi:Tol biopolymer transport system component
MNKKMLTASLTLLMLFLTGCGVLQSAPPVEDAVPTSTATVSAGIPTPTGAATDTATPTPVPPTSTPTAAPVPPTSTPTGTPVASTPTSISVPIVAPAPPSPTPTARLEGRFVFQVGSGGDIYVVNADGTDLRHLTKGMDPSWSPDGRQVIFVRWTEPWGIYLINADGSNERLLFSSNVARSPVFSPDGSEIAFFFTTEGWHPAWKFWIEGFGWYYIERGYPQTEWHLGVVDVADGTLHEPYCDNLSFSPTWTVDGERLIYDGVQGLKISDAHGASNLPFTDNPHDHFPVMSPEGSMVAIQHWEHDHWEIYGTGADGVGRWPLTSSSPLQERRPHNVSPAWSPDGSQIVFLSDRSGEWEFYVMDADGSNQRQILENVTQDLRIWYMAGNERMLSWTR